MSEERVHELLYSCDSRTELCEMIARLEDENAKLQASNEVIAEDHAALCDENNKLRELVQLMAKRPPISLCKETPCGECPVKVECAREDELMNELEVEVDG